MRVALVTETWQPCVDGVVTRLEQTVRHLTDRGHQVLLLAPTTGAPLPGLRQRRTGRIVLPFIDRARPWGLSDPRVRRLLDAFAPTVVHVVNPVLMGVAAAWSASRYPLVVSFHTDVSAYAATYRLAWTRPLLHRLMRLTYARADVLLATSAVGRRG